MACLQNYNAQLRCHVSKSFISKRKLSQNFRKFSLIFWKLYSIFRKLYSILGIFSHKLNLREKNSRKNMPQFCEKLQKFPPFWRNFALICFIKKNRNFRETVFAGTPYCVDYYRWYLNDAVAKLFEILGSTEAL